MDTTTKGKKSPETITEKARWSSRFDGFYREIAVIVIGVLLGILTT